MSVCRCGALRCLCGQPKPALAGWCYQCVRRIDGLADLSKRVVEARIGELELNLAHLRAAMEVGNNADTT